MWRKAAVYTARSKNIMTQAITVITTRFLAASCCGLMAASLMAETPSAPRADHTAQPGPATSAGAISLAGEWRFAISGTGTETIPQELTGKIRLPGTIDDAGLGPKNTKPPTLEGPYRLYDYAGPAWYQRDIEIPAGWQGKRVTLLLERCRWVTTVWLDDKRIGSQDSLIAPHIYDFGTGLTPGKHRLTLCVDNTLKINLGGFVSALKGGTWGNMNGIVGRIELAATPPVWIDDVQVYPDVDKMQARVVVKIGNATGKAGRGTVNVGGKGAEVMWETNGGKVEVIADMSGAKLWDEFSPNLSEVTVKLGDDKRTVRFGMRKFAAKGTQFTMNGRTLFLRGTLECSVFPLTGCPPTDVAAWQRIYRIMKSYGLNHIRFHSWCPPEAAFAAADQEGIMIQAEGPMANVTAGQDPKRDEFIAAEFKRIVDTYGNHPSFCTMTIGNEYGGKAELLTSWIDGLLQRDPRHLYSSAAEGQPTDNRQWTETGGGRGIHGPGTQSDVSNTVAHDPRPSIGHEIGQWMYFPDFNEIKKWNGVMALKNFEMIRDNMQKKNLLDLEPKYVEASGKLATLLYKEEIENLLRTPGYGGFSLLGLHDYPTQGTALVGPLNAFWESKGFVTPAAFRQYCGPTVPLLRMPKRTYTSDEAFEAKAQIAHYGPADLPNAQPVWQIKDEHGREVASGKLPSLTVVTGTLTELGAIKTPLASAPAPGKLSVTVSLAGTKFVNSWEIWVYPAKVAVVAPADVVACDEWNATAKAALAAGKKVLVTTMKVADSLHGSFTPVFWSPVWFPSQVPNTMGVLCDPKHPALAGFPTELSSNWQWSDVINQASLLNLDSAPAGFRPIVQVMDNFARNRKLGVLFEARVGKGRLLVCSINLKDDIDRRPAAKQLLASLYAYLASDKFQPAQELSPALLDGLLAKPSNSLSRLGAKVIQVDSEDPDHRASDAIDCDPATFWHTKWDPAPDPMPHQIVIDMGREVELKGVTYLPRQDMGRGRVAQCAVYCANDPSNMGEPAATAKFQDDYKLQKIDFQQPVKGRYLKFTVLSAIENTPFAAVAEIDILQTAP
jgi:hypothetical protein